MLVLLAEDREPMARALEKALHREGHSVVVALDGEQAFSFGSSEELDIIILDVVLPKLDGFTVIRKLREAKFATPTIMLTARDAMADIVRGLDAGADDYLTKPFALEILLARVRALGRRPPITHPTVLQFSDLALDTGTREARRGNRRVALTRTEFAILEVLIRRAGRIVPRDALIDAGWGLGAEVSENTIYVFIRNLREKIEQLGERPLLHTARGIGYILRAQPETSHA
jgi:DNA-binding response OmpR family regulator